MDFTTLENVIASFIVRSLSSEKITFSIRYDKEFARMEFRGKLHGDYEWIVIVKRKDREDRIGVLSIYDQGKSYLINDMLPDIEKLPEELKNIIEKQAEKLNKFYELNTYSEKESGTIDIKTDTYEFIRIDNEKQFD